MQVTEFELCTINKFAGLNFHSVSLLSRVLQKFFHEYKHVSLIILNNKHFWLRQHESIFAKTSMRLKLQVLRLAKLSTSTVIELDPFSPCSQPSLQPKASYI